MPDRLDLATFHPRVGQTFDVEITERSSIQLTLTEANLGPWQPHDGPATAFELLFQGPSDPILPQATYRLTHADLGPLDIFIVPIGQSNDGTTYQAVFN